MYAVPPQLFPSASTAATRITSVSPDVPITGLFTEAVRVFAALAKNVTVLAGNVLDVVAITIEPVPAVPSARTVKVVTPPVPRSLMFLPQIESAQTTPAPVTVAVTDSGVGFPSELNVLVLMTATSVAEAVATTATAESDAVV